MGNFVIEFEKGVYYAGWEGDPGRTLKIENAKMFKTEKTANKILQRELKNNPHRKFANAKVIEKASAESVNGCCDMNKTVEQMPKIQYIYFRESYLQSLFSDITSFGFLIFSIWFSAGSTIWTFVCVFMFIFMILKQVGNKARTFISKDELRKYIEQDLES
ncbi:hypothetical protein [Acinetobacter sp.]|uniref:hypothetical protein n=1 Tax=Acinetobacter sp. TaxID=472 RepID=UPI003CFE7E57